MNTQPLLIDNIAFAKRNEHVSGTLSVADCSRLLELITAQAVDSKMGNGASAGVINFTLDGETNAMGQHYLHLVVDANLNTHCQRCLEPMPLSLNLNFDYLIGDFGSQDSDVADIEDNDDYDLQEANQAMNLLTLIEDEVIMAMPIAPVHEELCKQASTQSGEKPNPFAVLKGLIK